MNPEDRKNWQGFIELFQPPRGYRLTAAAGTSFGLSPDALLAALLCMADADGEAMASDPVAAAMAITRMSSRVSVMVHPATISMPAGASAPRLIAMLDRLIVEIQPQQGLFHPKVWALKFERIGHGNPDQPNDVGRIVVGSRNLGVSSSFEAGVVLEGVVDDGEASPIARDVAKALRRWFAAAGAAIPRAVLALPSFLDRLGIEAPIEGEESLRLRWQGHELAGLHKSLPAECKRAVLVSPFVQPDFVEFLLARTSGTFELVSIPETLEALPGEVVGRLEQRAIEQGRPVLYQVGTHGDPEDAFIEGIHAKLLLLEDGAGHPMTFVGSANATGPGWGLNGFANVESVVEMRPGLPMDRFVADFIRPNKTTIHPWITEYFRDDEPLIDEGREAERRILAALREAARIGLVLRYDQEGRHLIAEAGDAAASLPAWVRDAYEVSFVPFLLAGKGTPWRALGDVQQAPCEFDEVEITDVSAFVLLRARGSKPQIEKQRLVVAELDLTQANLDRRDDLIRAEILASADPSDILNALVRGLPHFQGRQVAPGMPGTDRSTNIRAVLGQATLERLLHAIAVDRGLVTEMRKLLGQSHGEVLNKLFDELESALKSVPAEAA